MKLARAVSCGGGTEWDETLRGDYGHTADTCTNLCLKDEEQVLIYN